MSYYVYIAECADGSLYTGFTDDAARRIAAHNAGKGAKYTRSRLPVRLVYTEAYETAREARSREWHIKRLTRAEKLALIAAQSLKEASMYPHHEQSIEKLKEYFMKREGIVAIVLDGSVVKGNARPDSDIDAIVVVTDEEHRRLKEDNRLAEVIPGHCTYPDGYFDVKYKTKAYLVRAALFASEPTRNAFYKARVIYSLDDEIPSLVEKIARYPEQERDDKVRCFNANLQLNRGYFLRCVSRENAYMRSHLAQEIVYSVYRLILAENRVLFPCNRRLEETVQACSRRPDNILTLGRAFLEDVTEENCERFVQAFWKQSELPLTDDVSENCSQYVKFYEDWWTEENPPFPNEW